jgi:hypothetical protein
VKGVLRGHVDDNKVVEFVGSSTSKITEEGEKRFGMIPCTVYQSINHNMSLGPKSGGLIKCKMGLACPVFGGRLRQT